MFVVAGFISYIKFRKINIFHIIILAIYIYIYVCICMYVCIYICMYIYIYIYIFHCNIGNLIILASN